MATVAGAGRIGRSHYVIRPDSEYPNTFHAIVFGSKGLTSNITYSFKSAMKWVERTISYHEDKEYESE